MKFPNETLELDWDVINEINCLVVFGKEVWAVDCIDQQTPR